MVKNTKTKTKKIINTKKNNNKENTKSKNLENNIQTNYFISQSRLNRGQRKYCHCIMKLRSTAKTKKLSSNKSHYPVCKKLVRDCALQFQKNMKLNPKDYNPYKYDINKTNCVMNYDYSKYNIKDIRAFCQEKGISISFNNKDGVKQTYSKEKLVEKLVKHYLTKKFNK